VQNVRPPSAPINAAELVQALLVIALVPVVRQAVAEALAQQSATAPPAPAPLVSRHELARALSVSLATVDRLDREGQPYVRIGDAKRYDVAAVMAWHRERTASETKQVPQLVPAPTTEPAAQSGVRRVSVGGRRGTGKRGG
jgi:hypothetical protein